MKKSKTFLLFQRNSIVVQVLILFLMVHLFGRNYIFSQEEDNTGNWFVRDRAYPYDTIPVTSMLNALDYQKQMEDEYGFYLGPLQWTNIGPQPYNEEYNSYPRTGRVTCVKYYPNVPGFPQHPDWVYITGHNGGVWKSTDGGANFVPISDGLQTQSSGAIAFDPNNPNILYYGTGGNVYNYAYNFYGIGVYKSTDAGLTWSGPYRTGFLSFIYVHLKSL